MIDVTLACEDANSELVEVVTVADYDAEDNVGNSLLQIWELAFEDAYSKLSEVVSVADVSDEDRVGNSLLQRFGHKAKLLFRL